MTRATKPPDIEPRPVRTKLKSLQLKEFTAFGNVRLEFSPGLNVIVGENGLGKTHILKAAYCLLDVLGRGERDSGAAVPSKKYIQAALSRKLHNVFKPETLGRLARRHQGVTRSEVGWVVVDAGACSASFTTKADTEVSVQKVPNAWTDFLPVYLPPRELMSIYPGFVSLYETSHVEFDETLRDTCILLGAPLSKGQREPRARALLDTLEEAMGGKIELDKAGRFYLNTGEKTGQGRIEMHLVAEGVRKLAAIARLIATDSIFSWRTLFWDEPESNLHPQFIRDVAATIVRLAGDGAQIFIGTHSLFLLRELEILLSGTKVPARYFGLHKGRNGVSVEQGPSVNDMGNIGVLDEQLRQSERFLALGA